MIGFEYKAKMSEFYDIIKILSKKGNIYFNNLIKELRKIKINYITFDFVNKHVKLDDYFTNLNEAINPTENKNTLMMQKDSLRGQKILIVMLWSYDLNPSKENKKIVPENLFISGEINTQLKNKEDSKNKTRAFPWSRPCTFRTARPAWPYARAPSRGRSCGTSR